MKKLTVLNKSIITALCVALCVVLPMALHAIPKGGVLFSPMHLPVLLCGLVCGAPQYDDHLALARRATVYHTLARGRRFHRPIRPRW